MKVIAFFDFDGTITRQDSLLGFLIYSTPIFKLLLGFIFFLPSFFFMKIGLKEKSRVKEELFCFFFKGIPEDIFLSLSNSFADKHLFKTIRPDAKDRIEWHKFHGHEVVVVSASPEAWVGPICEELGISFITTRLEVVNGKITGSFIGKNCNGEEKVRRIKERYDVANYKTIYAYGDTQGDVPMLDIADNKGYKFFKR